MKLYGRKVTRRELEARVGRLEQVGGLKRVTLADGPEQGVEAIQVRTGAGLSYWVNASRGLDISLAEFGGVPLNWQGAPGDVHPAYYEAQGVEWLRTAVGGLLMTCGLTQAGMPCEEDGRSQGLHGRVHHIPARQVAAEGKWSRDDYEMRVAGVVEETSLIGDSLRLTREITSRLGENRIAINDTVENAGFTPAPHMMLYHFNFGFPLLDEKSTLKFPPAARVTPRNADTPMDGHDQWQEPDACYAERVYYHEGFKDKRVSAVISQPAFPQAGAKSRVPLSVRLSWATKNLPIMVQWKMPCAGVHVLGLEPANCHVGGRAAERQRGSLVVLQPGESRSYELELAVDTECTT